jgi:hypothetical protein
MCVIWSRHMFCCCAQHLRQVATYFQLLLLGLLGWPALLQPLLQPLLLLQPPELPPQQQLLLQLLC